MSDNSDTQQLQEKRYRIRSQLASIGNFLRLVPDYPASAIISVQIP